MKSFFLILLIAGLLVAGWMNRDKLRGFSGVSSNPGQDSTDTPESTTPRPVGTPHPANEAQAQAIALYPGLLRPETPLAKKFHALHREAQFSERELLSNPDWPLVLADRAMVSIGGVPVPRPPSATPVPAPSKLPGTSLDVRPSPSPSRLGNSRL